MALSDFRRMGLAEFRTSLQRLMPQDDLRPFVCDGSPLGCRVFIVGFNPATAMDSPFWQYWSDTSGFDKSSFMNDYRKKRNLTKLKGVRARIERIVGELPAGVALETNICSKPTRTAHELGKDDRTTDIFRFLFETIRPELVYVHSNEPVKYFQALTGATALEDNQFRPVEYKDHGFRVIATSGPLFRMGLEDATLLGREILGALR